MSLARKIVLVSSAGYNSSHDALLKSLIARRIFLFCAVGRDCERWEDVMDELVVGAIGEYDWYVTTTSHPGANTSEVLEFASEFHSEETTTIEVIDV